VTAGNFRGSAAPLDLVVPNFFPVGTVSVLLGNGDGTFQDAVPYRTGSNGPVAAVVGDFNNDGNLDLAVLNFNNADGVVSVLLGNGDGTFQDPITTHVGLGASALAVGDFNNDGNMDLVTADANLNAVSVLLGNGDGTFTVQSPVFVGPNPQSVAVGDFNGDGSLDIVTGNYNNFTANVLLGNGDGTFQNAVTYAAGFAPVAVTVGDLRGIGTQDVVVTNQDDTINVLLGNGDGTFQNAVPYPAGHVPTGGALIDVNNDGKLDFVQGNAAMNVLLGNGDGSFQAPLSYAAGAGARAVVAGDFNGDGFADVAVPALGSGVLSVLINNVDWSGGGGFSPLPTPPTTFPVSSQPTFSAFPSQIQTVANSVFARAAGMGDASFQESRPTTVAALSSVAADQVFANLDAFLLGSLLQKDSGRVSGASL
jgi:hypothetical protein